MTTPRGPHASALAPAPATPAGRAAPSLAASRTDANRRFFAAEADRIARLCRRMAERFAAGGRLLAVGDGTPAALSDVRHVAVEFVHPVIVGKRALPALGLFGERELATLLGEEDIVVRFAGGGATIDGEAFDPPCDDPFVRQELTETLYHVLWELVHVFLDHQGAVARDAGAASFLYAAPVDMDAVVADVAASVLMKAEEIAALREQTLGEGGDELRAAAAALRLRFDGGGALLALGNGGSATDAMDVVADFRDPPGQWPARRAIDLSEDPAILTAIANDIGVEAIFLRQVIAYGRARDALLALSTSGDSGNVIAALGEARKRGMLTIAMVGYDGGRVAEEGLADHVIVTRSQHIPRIQEAQASAYHVLRELVER